MIIVDGPDNANFTLVLTFSGGSGKGITGIFGVEQLFAAINRMDSTATDKINKVMVATEEIRTPRQHKLLKVIKKKLVRKTLNMIKKTWPPGSRR